MTILADKAHYESHLEAYIVQKLEAQGWVVGQSKNYLTEYALYPEDLLAWIKATQPEKWEKLEALNGNNAEKRLFDRLDDELNKKGTIHIFRNGFQIAGAGTIDISESAPEDGRNQMVIDRYKANILRVVPQLKYHPAKDGGIIDLVFFINGLPMATVEIKTEFNQSLEHAIEQYKNDRKPIDSKTRRKEPLLLPKRGAVVHFALCESEIAMTTALAGEDTFFLPFNKGSDGHAGNPPADASKGEEYPVAYFYDYICQPDNWLRIFHNFVYIEKKDVVDLYGNWSVQERMIFPRYHQLDAVNKIVTDVQTKGVGSNYLCEHSAGSGKTSTISWLCHSLVRLRHDDGTPYFNSVIVVTDRTVLDDQLQEAIQQLDHQKGLIAAINRDDKENAGKSKNKQLEEALVTGKPIIIVTIQTFPHVMEAILTNTSLNERNFAVVIDEAHASQTGSTASKLKATLALKSNEDMADLSIEELLEQLQKARVQSNNISHFAFTATPKHSTKMLFGTTPNGGMPTDDNLPESFHLYPQRQAIEEGFILDVLQGYMPYKTAFKLGGEAVENKRVGTKEAKKSLARWMSLHATNVTQKVQFIIQHFHHNVAHLLNGEAKAMIVTSSRPAAARYKIALEKYIEKNPEYSDYRVLVAFSGKLTGEQLKHEADADTESRNLFKFADDDEFTEASMNTGIPNSDLRVTFNRPEYRLMVVANKFQTGFDQPKLCAMYLDKKIANEVEVVQTLSRLNRTFSGKDQTFIIDFVNDPEWILKCFKKYDSGAEIIDAQDFNVVYTIKDNIEELGLFGIEDLEEFKAARFKTIREITNGKFTENSHPELYKATDRVARLYNQKLKMLQQAIRVEIESYNRAKANGNDQGADKAEYERKKLDIELQTLTRFKGNLAKFSRIYTYIAQMIDLGDPELENFSAFTKLLSKRLNGVSRKEVDISGLVLTGFGIIKQEIKDEEDIGGGKPMPLASIQGTQNGDISASPMAYISEIIETLGHTFGDIGTKEQQVLFLNSILAVLFKDNIVMAQIENNTEENIMKGNLPNATTGAIIESFTQFEELSAYSLTEGNRVIERLIPMLAKLLKEGRYVSLEDLPQE